MSIWVSCLHNYYKSTSKDFCNFLVKITAIYYQSLRKVKSDRCFYTKFIIAFELKLKCQHTLN